MYVIRDRANFPDAIGNGCNLSTGDYCSLACQLGWERLLGENVLEQPALLPQVVNRLDGALSAGAPSPGGDIARVFAHVFIVTAASVRLWSGVASVAEAFARCLRASAVLVDDTNVQVSVCALALGFSACVYVCVLCMCASV